MYIIEPASIHIEIQKILNKSEKTTVNSEKSHSIKLHYLRNIVPRFEVDWIKSQGEIAHQNLTLMHIEIQTILNKSGRTTQNLLKRYSMQSTLC